MNIKKISSLSDRRGATSARFTDSISMWVGSWSFFNIHLVWFAVWLIVRWDIGLLTMIVSLEAIILMILLLMQQNRQVQRDNMRDDADYQIDQKTMHLAQENKRLLHALQKEVAKLERLVHQQNRPSRSHGKKNS